MTSTQDKIELVKKYIREKTLSKFKYDGITPVLLENIRAYLIGHGLTNVSVALDRQDPGNVLISFDPPPEDVSVTFMLPLDEQ